MKPPPAKHYVAEACMHYAWLEFHRGFWLLLTVDAKLPMKGARRWTDEKTALADLMDEGWTVSGAYPRRTSIDNEGPGLRFRGFTFCEPYSRSSLAFRRGPDVSVVLN